MGYMDITISGSDTASDLDYFVKKALTNKKPKSEIIKILQKEMKDKGNKFNTPGVINVALVILEGAAVALSKSPGFKELKEDVRKNLIKFIEKSENAEWEDESNKKWHLSQYKSILQSL